MLTPEAPIQKLGISCALGIELKNSTHAQVGPVPQNADVSTELIAEASSASWPLPLPPFPQISIAARQASPTSQTVISVTQRLLPY